MAGAILPGVVYARKSTDRQEASVREQQQWAARAAEVNKVQVAAEFADEGVSGSEIAARDGLQQLIRFVEGRTADPIRVVVCWSIDRLSRSDTLETFEVLSRLRRAGVRSILTNSKTYDLHDMTDRTLLAVEQDFTNNHFLKKLSEGTTRSLNTRAKDGRWLGRIPYGYVIGPDGRLTPGDPDAVEAVRWLFAAAATTAASLRELARKMTARGAPPPKGEWTRYTVHTILRNVAYTGTYRWNAHTLAKHCHVRGGEVAAVNPGDVPPARPGAKVRPRVRNAPADVVEIRDAHPALVDPETFRAVAKRLAAHRHRRTTPTRGRVWPLSGLVRCGNCGARMVGRSDLHKFNGKSYTYEILTCSGTGLRGCGTCRTNRVRQERIVAEVAALIRERFTDPDQLAELRGEVDAAARAEQDVTEGARGQLRDRIADLDRRIDRGAENLLLCPPAVRDRAAAKLTDWQAERDQLARDLMALEAAAENRQGTAARVAEALGVLATLEESVAAATAAGDLEAVRDLFAGVVREIRLQFRHGRQLRNGSRRTWLAAVQVDLLPEVSYLLSSRTRTRWPR
jgi:DNA invertase Pin-like site-specific DNA recombinase